MIPTETEAPAASAADTDAPANAATDTSADDLDLMAIAAEADRALGAPETAPAKEDAQPGEQGKKTEAKPQDTDPSKTATPGEQGADEKPQSAFSKAQKEKERQDRSWKALDQEKAAFREVKTRYEQELETLRREVQQLKAGPAKDEHGVDAATYDQIAKKYHEEGNDEMANLARERAEKLRRQTPAATERAPSDISSPEFQAGWQKTTQQLIAEDRELGNPENPVVKAANSLLQDKTWGAFLTARPDGLRAAVEVGRLLQKSARVDALQKELDTAKAEVGRLTKLTQPRGGHPTQQRPGASTDGDVSDDELMAIARAADGG
ncbi:MAG: hypothetical protein B9S38_02435 [Verrucomicrobiia bacterium Tous-C4TDCM]|nr:MAG: hypothetical protein B9S38_02435 [Verrucomicrobiae bacterium Tous-C4TDCM]